MVRLSGVCDEVDPAAAVAFPDLPTDVGVEAEDETAGAGAGAGDTAAAAAEPPAGSAWVLLVECDGGRCRWDDVQGELDRAIAGTLPQLQVAVAIVPLGWLVREDGGCIDVPATREKWRERRRRIAMHAVESKPLSGEVELLESADGTSIPGTPGADPFQVACAFVQRALVERHPELLVLACLEVDDRLVGTDRLTPSDVLGLVDDLALQAGQPLEVRRLADIGGATIASLARLLAEALARRGPVNPPSTDVEAAEPEPSEVEGPSGTHDRPEPDEPDGTPHPRGAREFPTDRLIDDEDDEDDDRGHPLVAGRVEGPFADPIEGAGGETQADATITPPAPGAVVPVAPRFPVAARRAGGSGIRRAARTLRRAGVPIRPGLVAYAPLQISVAPGGTVEIGRNVTVLPDVTIRVAAGATLRLHAGVTISSGTQLDVRSGVTTIGAGVMVRPGLHLLADADVLIGRETVIGTGVTIRATADAPPEGIVLDAGRVIAAGTRIVSPTPMRRAG